MNLEFKLINIERDFVCCLKFREDSYLCSFVATEGYQESVGQNGVIYHQKIAERIDSCGWRYIHIWKNDKIIGQLEFKSFSQKANYGYIHLFYLIPECRGQGLAAAIHDYVKDQLQEMDCLGAILSVSKINARAISFYKKQGWSYLAENPNNPKMQFLACKF